MPGGEYSGITLKKGVAERLKQVALRTNRTVPSLIEHMLETQYPNKPVEVFAYPAAKRR